MSGHREGGSRLERRCRAVAEMGERCHQTAPTLLRHGVEEEVGEAESREGAGVVECAEDASLPELANPWFWYSQRPPNFGCVTAFEPARTSR